MLVAATQEDHAAGQRRGQVECEASREAAAAAAWSINSRVRSTRCWHRFSVERLQNWSSGSTATPTTRPPSASARMCALAWSCRAWSRSKWPAPRACSNPISSGATSQRRSVSSGRSEARRRICGCSGRRLDSGFPGRIRKDFERMAPEPFDTLTLDVGVSRHLRSVSVWTFRLPRPRLTTSGPWSQVCPCLLLRARAGNCPSLGCDSTRGQGRPRCSQRG